MLPCIFNIINQRINFIDLQLVKNMAIYMYMNITVPMQAYTLDGDQILPNCHYYNKTGTLGIIGGSDDIAIR